MQTQTRTLKDIITGRRCRKGTAAGTTKRGAYWLACEPIEIRSYGGRGIGNDQADRSHQLELRHYRDGEVSAAVRCHSWHQDTGTQNHWVTVGICDCTTVEDVVVALKGKSDEEWGHLYSDRQHSELAAALMKLGLPLAAPSPDDEPAPAPAPVA